MKTIKVIALSLLLYSTASFTMTPPMEFEKIEKPFPPFSFGGLDIDPDEKFDKEDFIDDEKSAAVAAIMFRDNDISLYYLLKKASKEKE